MGCAHWRWCWLPQIKTVHSWSVNQQVSYKLACIVYWKDKCYQPWDRLLALTCHILCKSDNQNQRGLCLYWSSIWQTESVVTDCGLIWWTGSDWCDSSLFLCSPALFQGLMPLLIDWSLCTALYGTALPCSIYTALSCSRDGKLSLLSQYHYSLLPCPLSLSARSQWLLRW